MPLGSLMPFEDFEETEEEPIAAESSSNASVVVPSKKAKAVSYNDSSSNGYENHVLVKTKVQKSLLTDVNGMVAASTAPPPPPPVDHSVEDYCFVCGQDGKLLVCDFPGCLKVYHKVGHLTNMFTSDYELVRFVFLDLILVCLVQTQRKTRRRVF